MKKLVLDVPDDQFAELCALQQVLGLATLIELFNTSLSLMKWVVNERQAGRIIASVDDANQLMKELQMDSLDQVKPKP